VSYEIIVCIGVNGPQCIMHYASVTRRGIIHGRPFETYLFHDRDRRRVLPENVLYIDWNQILVETLEWSEVMCGTSPYTAMRDRRQKLVMR